MGPRHRLKASIYAIVPALLANLMISSALGALQFFKRVTRTRGQKDALNALVNDREEVSAMGQSPMTSVVDRKRLPDIDISIVTYNSKKWIDGFVESLLELDYPKKKLNLFFVDNSSSDGTLKNLQSAALALRRAGMSVSVASRPNRGYGAGNNFGISEGKSPFCLITNIDLEFEADSLAKAASHALSDLTAAATWEFRQKPFEHPKVYDPISGATNWNSHACVLVRRAAFEAVGGYNETLFMYGEDVELSYRLKAQGYKLRYNPHAVVYHHTYASANEVKPVQFYGSKFANLYIRMLYGDLQQLLAIVPLLALFLVRPGPQQGSLRTKLRSISKLFRLAPAALRKNFGSRRACAFPFRGWDYDVVRKGAFCDIGATPKNGPKVSIITRTYKGREHLLRQAMLSVANQTYHNIELLVTEDRGTTLKDFVAAFKARQGLKIRYVSGNEIGRSDAGNRALDAATGRWCLFLDDDDLLFCDHVEILVSKLLATPDAPIAYSLAFDVPTAFLNGSYSEAFYQSHNYMASEFSHQKIRYGNLFPIQAVIFDRRLFLERGGFDTKLDALEDWVLWQKYTYKNNVAFVPKTTSLYRTPLGTSIFSKRRSHFQNKYKEISTQMEAWRKSMNDRS